MKRSAKIGIIVAGVIIALGAMAGIVFAMQSNPRDTLDDFLKAVEAQNEDAAMALVSTDIKTAKNENVRWFVEDWVIAKNVSHEFETDKAWRSRVMMMDQDGTMTPQMNEYGFEKKEIKPTAWPFAHHYEAEVTVHFSDGEDEYEDPVRIKLVRETDNTWSLFGQLFHKWKVSNITYQPLDEEDFESLESGEDDFIDLTDSEEIIELDENGEVVNTEETTEEQPE